MKFMHLGDLHLGKRLREFSLLEDEAYILRQILDLAAAHAVDAVLIAGDIYDKSVPPPEAVELFDWFLTELARRKTPCCAVGGNHDSAERLAFGAQIMAAGGVHFAPVFDGKLHRAVLEDGYGPVSVYLLPFLRPAVARRFFPEVEPGDYDGAVRRVLAHAGADFGARNVIVAHQFVTAAGEEPQRSESEVNSVGGLDNVDISAFDGFDYVALGHLHRAQRVGRETARYCGSPLKFSLSELCHKKSVTLVELGRKGEVRINQSELSPRREMRAVAGPIEDLLAPSFLERFSREDYYYITVTGAQVLDAMGKLRHSYPNLVELRFASEAGQQGAYARPAPDAEKTVLTWFSEFYLLQKGEPLDGRREDLLSRMLQEMGGEER